MHDGYGIDLSTVLLDTLREWLLTDDLLPGHLPLREGLDAHLAALRALGIETVQQIVDLLPTTTKVQAAAARSGIPADVLLLLRRHVRGYLPTPISLAEIPTLDPTLVRALAQAGVPDTRALYGRTRTTADRTALAAACGVDAAALAPPAAMADLARAGWLGPLGVAWFAAAGVRSAADLAAQEPTALAARLAAANADRAFGKVTVGARDLARVICIARRLPAA